MILRLPPALPTFALLSTLLLSLDALAQCTKDIECKGERICMSGACVFPPEQNQSRPSSAPQLTAGPAPAIPPAADVPAASPSPAAPVTAPNASDSSRAEGAPVMTSSPDATPAVSRPAQGNIAPAAAAPAKVRSLPPTPPSDVVRELPARRFALTTDPLATVAMAVAVSAMATSAGTTGSLLYVPANLHIAVHPQVTLGLTLGIGGGQVGTSALGVFAAGAHARFHPFSDAPAGFWLGASLLGVSTSAAGSSFGSTDFTTNFGYQWVHDSGFVIGVGGGLSITSLAAGAFPLALYVPIGVAF